MAWSQKLKPVSFIFAAVLIFGLTAYILWHPARDAEDQLSARNPPPSAGEPPVGEPGDSAVKDFAPRTTLPGAQPRGSVEPSSQRTIAATGVVIPHDVVLQDYKTELWAGVLEAPPEFTKPGDPTLDADTAYKLYMYYGNCSVMRSRGQYIDRQIEKIADRAEKAEGTYLDDLEGRLDQIINYYELCQRIPAAVDGRREAVTWMTEAVRLGHEIAEVQFYQKAMWFLLLPDPSSNSPPLAMQYPGLVEDFKTTARLALARALEKGHPEAYLAKAQAVLEGMIYPTDPLLAYAYARKAELEAAKNQLILKDIATWKEQAADYLGQEQIAEAEQMALELGTPQDG